MAKKTYYAKIVAINSGDLYFVKHDFEEGLPFLLVCKVFHEAIFYQSFADVEELLLSLKRGEEVRFEDDEVMDENYHGLPEIDAGFTESTSDGLVYIAVSTKAEMTQLASLEAEITFLNVIEKHW